MILNVWRNEDFEKIRVPDGIWTHDPNHTGVNNPHRKNLFEPRLKAREAFLIKKDRTIDPDGLNIRKETY